MIMMIRGQICNLIHGLKPVLMMVLVQIVFAGTNILYKLAVNDGMSLRVLVAYRFIIGAAFMAPVALFLERKSRRKLNLKILSLAFLSGLFGGSLCQNLIVESLALTSATFVSAILNLSQAMTFILAVSIGFEKLGIRTTAGQVKLFGTLIGIGGAMLLTFYKGPAIKIWSTHVDLLHHNQLSDGHVASLHADSGKSLLGCFFCLASCFCFSLWLIIQAKMSKEYPHQYSSTALMCTMGAMQSVVFALCMEKDWSQWKLGWNIRLISVTYSGIIVSGLTVSVISWCIRMRGPLFASAFNPLTLVVVVFLGSLILNEKLHLGSVLGAAIIVCGLYCILWGQGKEMKKRTQLVVANEFSTEESDPSIEIVITSPTDLQDMIPEKINEEKQEKDAKEKEENNTCEVENKE